MDIAYQSVGEGIKLSIQKPIIKDDSKYQLFSDVENSNMSLLKLKDCSRDNVKTPVRCSSVHRPSKIKSKHTHLVGKEKIHSPSSVNMISCTIQKPSRKHSSEDATKSEKKHRKNRKKPDRKPGMLALCVTDLSKPYEAFKARYNEKETDSISGDSIARQSLRTETDSLCLNEDRSKIHKRHKHRHRDSSSICAKQLVQVARMLNDEEFRNKILKDEHNEEKRKHNSRKCDRDSTPSDEQSLSGKSMRKERHKKDKGLPRGKHRKDKLELCKATTQITEQLSGTNEKNKVIEDKLSNKINIDECKTKSDDMQICLHNNAFIERSLHKTITQDSHSKPIISTLFHTIIDDNENEKFITLTYDNSSKNKKENIARKSNNFQHIDKHFEESSDQHNNDDSRTISVSNEKDLESFEDDITKTRDESCQSSLFDVEGVSNNVSDVTIAADNQYRSDLIENLEPLPLSITEPFNELIGDNPHNQSLMQSSSIDLVVFPASENAIQKCSKFMLNKFNNYSCGDKIRCKDNDSEINRKIQESIELNICKNIMDDPVVDDKEILIGEPYTFLEQEAIETKKSDNDFLQENCTDKEYKPQTFEGDSAFGCIENSRSLDRPTDSPLTNVMVMQCAVPLCGQSPHHIRPKMQKAQNLTNADYSNINSNFTSKVLECNNISIIVNEDQLTNECKVILAPKENNTLGNYVKHPEIETKIITASPSHIELKPVCTFTIPVKVSKDDDIYKENTNVATGGLTNDSIIKFCSKVGIYVGIIRF